MLRIEQQQREREADAAWSETFGAFIYFLFSLGHAVVVGTS